TMIVGWLRLPRRGSRLSLSDPNAAAIRSISELASKALQGCADLVSLVDLIVTGKTCVGPIAEGSVAASMADKHAVAPIEYCNNPMPCSAKAAVWSVLTLVQLRLRLGEGYRALYRVEFPRLRRSPCSKSSDLPTVRRLPLPLLAAPPPLRPSH